MTLDIITKSSRTAVQAEDESQAAQDYKNALRLFWKKNPQELIDFVGEVIENSQNEADVFVFYRLWIEQLSDLNEEPALQKMLKHLLVRSYAHPQHNITWQALRGLIHFELDEMEAVDLVSRVLSRNKTNPYCLELMQKINFRSAEANLFDISLLGCRTTIEDYFHWQSVAQALVFQGRNKDLDCVLRHTEKIFAGAPMRAEFLYHMHIDKHEYSLANHQAKRLMSLFSSNLDYRFLAGYSSYCDLDYKSAIAFLSDSSIEIEDLNEADPDVLSILAMSFSKIAQGNVGDPAHGRALEFLERAEECCRLKNLPTLEIRSLIERMLAEQKEYMNVEIDIDSYEPNQCWIVKMTPRQYFDMQSESGEEHGIIRRAIGDSVHAEDLVFFAAENPLDPEGRWRIVSIYSAVSGPVWDPMNQCVNELELISKMESPLEVDIYMHGDDAGEEVGDSSQSEVYLLEGGALEVITGAVRRRNENEFLGENEETKKSGKTGEKIS